MNEQALLRTLTRVVTALTQKDIAFAVAGGCAVYARGGPVTTHDIDIFLREQDVPSAAAALHEAGLRLEDPPENWLTKAYDGSVLVDLIFCPPRPARRRELSGSGRTHANRADTRPGSHRN